MSLWQAVLLGIIQGLTEFLPVSSDGHLVLADQLLQLPLEGRDALGFDILLHAGSLLAILIAYASTWKKLMLSALRRERDAWLLIAFLIVATIPGVFAGLLFEDAISDMRSLRSAALGFLVTAIVLIAGEYIGRRREQNIALKDIGYMRALLIGCAQAIAILPGVSRSGSTISVARTLGLNRPIALDFSFLMAAPIIAGAVGKTLLDAWSGDVVFPVMTIALSGFAVSFIVSMGAIALLKLLVVRRSLGVFAWYLLPLSAVLLVMDMAG